MWCAPAFIEREVFFHVEERSAASHPSSGNKTCGKCSTSKPFVEFNTDARRPDGLFPYCKACRRELRRTRYREDKDYSHARAVKKTYGLSAERYQVMHESQNGRCAIYGTHASQTTGKGKRLQVDHDHATGTIRELLCASCNTDGPGQFQGRPYKPDALPRIPLAVGQNLNAPKSASFRELQLSETGAGFAVKARLWLWFLGGGILGRALLVAGARARRRGRSFWLRVPGWRWMRWSGGRFGRGTPWG